MPRLLWLLARSSAELGPGGEIGYQLLLDAQGLVVVLLRLLEPAHGLQQTAAVVVALARSWRNSGREGKSRRQLLPDAQGLVVVLLRLRQSPRGTQQNTPVAVATGQILAVLG